MLQSQPDQPSKPTAAAPAAHSVEDWERSISSLGKFLRERDLVRAEREARVLDKVAGECLNSRDLRWMSTQVMLAEAAFAGGRYNDGRGFLRRAIDLAKSSYGNAAEQTHKLYDRAIDIAVRHRDYPAVQQFCGEFESCLSPNNILHNALLAGIRFNQGLAEALASQDPSKAYKRYTEGFLITDRIAEKKPEEAAAPLICFARVLEIIGRPKDSYEFYKRADQYISPLTESPVRPVNLLEMSTAAFHAGHIERALELVRESSTNPRIVERAPYKKLVSDLDSYINGPQARIASLEAAISQEQKADNPLSGLESRVSLCWTLLNEGYFSRAADEAAVAREQLQQALDQYPAFRDAINNTDLENLELLAKLFDDVSGPEGQRFRQMFENVLALDSIQEFLHRRRGEDELAEECAERIKLREIASGWSDFTQYQLPFDMFYKNLMEEDGARRAGRHLTELERRIDRQGAALVPNMQLELLRARALMAMIKDDDIEADVQFSRALEIVEQNPTLKRSTTYVALLINMTGLHERNEEPALALEFGERAVQAMRDAKRAEHPLMIRILDRLAELYELNSEFGMARDVREEQQSVVELLVERNGSEYHDADESTDF